MTEKDTGAKEIRRHVGAYYAEAAQRTSGCGCSPSPECCGGETIKQNTISTQFGYSSDELNKLPVGADMGLGCGNPVAIAGLKPGEVVLDLGSGGGIDCFLAAKRVGENGRVIGVDMTPEMVSKARENASTGGFENVEFHLSEIERLSVADESVDIVMSNCVINLASDKRPVYREAFRVLKPGGRLAISDIVALEEVPEDIRNDVKMWSQCAAGALTIDELKQILFETGFEQVKVTPVESSRASIKQWFKGRAGNVFVSAMIEAVKPR